MAQNDLLGCDFIEQEIQTIQDIELDQGLEYYLLTKQNWDLEC